MASLSITFTGTTTNLNTAVDALAQNYGYDPVANSTETKQQFVVRLIKQDTLEKVRAVMTRQAQEAAAAAVAALDVT